LGTVTPGRRSAQHTYLTAAQHGQKSFFAAEVHEKVLLWLRKFRCEALVEPHIVELYALYSARWIMCEEAISEYGLLAKHPTTRQPIATPYAAMSQNYAKQAAALWTQMQANDLGQHYIIKDRLDEFLNGRKIIQYALRCIYESLRSQVCL